MPFLFLECRCLLYTASRCLHKRHSLNLDPELKPLMQLYFIYFVNNLKLYPPPPYINLSSYRVALGYGTRDPAIGSAGESARTPT